MNPGIYEGISGGSETISMEALRNWLRRQLSDPQVIVLILLLGAGFLVITLLSKKLTPVLVSLVLAYLLEGLVGMLQKVKVPRFLAVLLVFSFFLCLCIVLLVFLVPLIVQQIQQLFTQLPVIVQWIQGQLMRLPETYPEYITKQQVSELISFIRSAITVFGQKVFSYSIASVMGAISIVVYFFLVPLMVFFFLKDKDLLLQWFTGFLPRERSLAVKIWQEVDRQIGNYIRGKVWEIFILWSVTTVVFTFLGLDYALLLGLFTGLSVVIPYIGAGAMVVPVALIAYFQWGWSSQFGWAVAAYTVIQILDGNVLAPLLFSEVVNLHPIAIVSAVLFFGGLYGFWGVFFAIPLATLIQSIIMAWPRNEMKSHVS